jgi:hypothetical protein
MINPTIDDVGRKVIYRRGTKMQEEGVISTFTNRWVFVQYSEGTKATHRADLDWAITDTASAP